jgi:hypothetical protein
VIRRENNPVINEPDIEQPCLFSISSSISFKYNVPIKVDRVETTYLKSAFIEAFEKIGGVDNLVEWARCNQTEFCGMLARFMSRKIHAFIKRRRQVSKERIITEASIKMKKERTISPL